MNDLSWGDITWDIFRYTADRHSVAVGLLLVGLPYVFRPATATTGALVGWLGGIAGLVLLALAAAACAFAAHQARQETIDDKRLRLLVHVHGFDAPKEPARRLHAVYTAHTSAVWTWSVALALVIGAGLYNLLPVLPLTSPLDLLERTTVTGIVSLVLLAAPLPGAVILGYLWNEQPSSAKTDAFHPAS